MCASFFSLTGKREETLTPRVLQQQLQLQLQSLCVFNLEGCKEEGKKLKSGTAGTPIVRLTTPPFLLSSLSYCSSLPSPSPLLRLLLLLRHSRDANCQRGESTVIASSSSRQERVRRAGRKKERRRRRRRRWARARPGNRFLPSLQTSAVAEVIALLPELTVPFHFQQEIY